MTDADHTPADRAPTVFDHLVELRSRLLRAVAGLLLVFVALLPVANRLYAFLAQPLLDKLPSGGYDVTLVGRRADALAACAAWFPPSPIAPVIALTVAGLALTGKQDHAGDAVGRPADAGPRAVGDRLRRQRGDLRILSR